MEDELVLFGHNLDQPIPNQGDEWITNKVNEIIQEAIQKKDPEIALSACQNLITITKLSGKALSKILYTLYRFWDDFNATENFWDTVFIRIGFHQHTVERYVRVGALLTEGIVPKDILPKLEERNIGEIIPIANTVAEGYDISLENWTDLLNQPDTRSISRKLLEIKGEEPRKAGLRIYLDGHGSLWCEVTGEPRMFVGSLEISDENPLVQRAINRIIDHTGVIR